MAPRHVCDGLTHLAGRLDQILQTWNTVDSDSPSPSQIERLYRTQYLDQALHLLRLRVSVDYAKELEAAVVGPLRHFQALEFRACQLLNGDTSTTSTTMRRHAVRTYLAERYRYWRGRAGSRDQVVDPVFDEIEEGSDQIRIEFEAAVRYLRNAAEAIRTLAAEDQEVDHDQEVTIPPDLQQHLDQLPPRDRPAYRRDHTWLYWNATEGIGPAAIRDRWKDMDVATRKAISPNCFDDLGSFKEQARKTVATGIRRAKKD